MAEKVQLSEEQYKAFQAWLLTEDIENTPGWFTEDDLFDHNEDGMPSELEEIEWEVLDGSAEHNWQEIAEIAFEQAQRGYVSINWLHLLRQLKKDDTSCCKYRNMEEREQERSKNA